MEVVLNKRKKGRTKKVYIVLTYTGTVLSKIIRLYTRAEFCHVSIALDQGLNEMYSFGRLNPYNPFIGGFVHEGLKRGTFKRFKNTKAAIYSINLTNQQYKTIKRTIKKFKKRKHLYTFNVIGLFATAFNIKYKKDNSFYCAEFIKYLMEQAQLQIELPELIKPNDFKNINNSELKYQGILREYKVASK